MAIRICLILLCGPFTEYRERIQKFRLCNLKQLYRNKLDKTCFAYNAAYSDSKDLAKRTISDKVLKDRTYEIARSSKYDGYRRRFASIVCRFFEKKPGSQVSVNENLAGELQKSVIKKIKRSKVYKRFKDNIWNGIATSF